jgi:hypothetical protein
MPDNRWTKAGKEIRTQPSKETYTYQKRKNSALGAKKEGKWMKVTNNSETH